MFELGGQGLDDACSVLRGIEHDKTDVRVWGKRLVMITLFEYTIVHFIVVVRSYKL